MNNRSSKNIQLSVPRQLEISNKAPSGVSPGFVFSNIRNVVQVRFPSKIVQEHSKLDFSALQPIQIIQEILTIFVKKAVCWLL